MKLIIAHEREPAERSYHGRKTKGTKMEKIGQYVLATLGIVFAGTAGAMLLYFMWMAATADKTPTGYYVRMQTYSQGQEFVPVGDGKYVATDRIYLIKARVPWGQDYTADRQVNYDTAMSIVAEMNAANRGEQ